MSRVLALVDDLMFLSRIREAGRGAGVEVRSVRQPGALVDGLREGASLVLLDADSDRLPWAEALAAAREAGLLDPARIVAFASHVSTDRVEAARAAGCGRVLARGAFVTELPTLLTATAVPPPSKEEPKP